MGCEKGKQVWGFLLETHVYWSVGLWCVESVCAVKDFEVFVCHLLNKLWCGLLVFVVRRESRLLGVEEPSN